MSKYLAKQEFIKISKEFGSEDNFTKYLAGDHWSVGISDRRGKALLAHIIGCKATDIKKIVPFKPLDGKILDLLVFLKNNTIVIIENQCNTADMDHWARALGYISKVKKHYPEADHVWSIHLAEKLDSNWLEEMKEMANDSRYDVSLLIFNIWKVKNSYSHTIDWQINGSFYQNKPKGVRVPGNHLSLVELHKKYSYINGSPDPIVKVKLHARSKKYIGEVDSKGVINYKNEQHETYGSFINSIYKQADMNRHGYAPVDLYVYIPGVKDWKKLGKLDN